MASQFRIQVVDETGAVAATWIPGSTAEQDLTSAVVAAAIGKGVGVFKTEAKVAAAIEGALKDVLYNLKASVQPG